MGLLVPTYTSRNQQSNTFSNVYMSTRFEPVTLLYNTDGTYCLSGIVKVYQNKTDMFTIDQFGVTLRSLTKTDINQPVHNILYSNLMATYSNSTPCEP